MLKKSYGFFEMRTSLSEFSFRCGLANEYRIGDLQMRQSLKPRLDQMIAVRFSIFCFFLHYYFSKLRIQLKAVVYIVCR